MATGSEKGFGEVEATLEKSGRADDLIKLYEARAREVPSADEAAHLLSRAGDLAKEKLRDVVRAEQLFRSALVYAPRAKEALEGLKALAEQRNDFAGLVEALERLAQVSAPAYAAQLYLQAGDLSEGRLGRRDRAVVCYLLAVRSAPTDRAPYERARHLLMDEERFESAFDLLEKQRVAFGEKELLEAYLVFAEALLTTPEAHSLATKALVRAQAIDDKNARATAATKELSKLEYVWREKVKTIRAQSLEARDKHVAARLSLQVARLYAFYEPDAVAKIKEAIDRCFALWPAMPAALDVLEKVALKSGDVRSALTIFSRLAAETRDKGAQVDLQLRIGQVLLTRLGQKEDACAAFAQAASFDPGRPDAATLASELLIELGNAAEGVAVMERHLSTVRDRSAHVALRLSLAELSARLLKDDARVRAHLEAALAVDPQNTLVAFRLAKAYADGGELEKLLPIAELASAAPVPVAQRVTLCELAALLCEEADDARGAFTTLSWALLLDPSNTSLAKSLGEAAAKAQMPVEHAVALRRAVQVASVQAQPALWRSLAQILETQQRPSEAVEAWLEVQTHLPGDAEVAERLAALRKVVAIEADPRSKLAAEAARLEASSADPEAAAVVYRKMLELDPESVPVLQKLAQVANRLGRWHEVAEVAERLTALAGSPAERQTWRTTLVQMYAERLGRHDEAVTLALSLLEEGVTTAPVVGGLERLAAAGIRRGDISRALAPHYARTGDHQRQVASLLVQLSTEGNSAEQLSLLSLLAETSERKLLDERAALDFRLRAVALAPHDTQARGEAARLAKGLGLERELARALLQLAPKAEGQVGQALFSEAAAVLEEAGVHDEAAQALTLALNARPDQPVLLSRLSLIYQRAQRFSELELTLRKRITLAAGDERRSLLTEVATVTERLGRYKEAAQALEETLALGAEPVETLPRIAALHEMSASLRELVAVQQRLMVALQQAGRADDAAQIGKKRARVLEQGLGEKAEAIARYDEVLKAQPADEEALGALEALLTDAQHREAAARALVNAHRASGDRRKEAVALGVIGEAARDTADRVTAYREAAELHGAVLRQPEQAFFSLAAAVRLAPDDIGLRTLARSAAEEADVVDSYVEMLEELLPQAAPGVALALHHDLADLAERKQNDHRLATQHLNAVLVLDASNVAALKSLLRLHRAHEEWVQLLPVLERLAGLETDPAAKAALEREAAVLCEGVLEDPERAAANWRLIVARDSLAKDAAVALERLYTYLDKPEELAFALELRRNQEGPTAAGRELTFKLGQLRRERLNDASGALELLRQVLLSDATHEAARATLDGWARSEHPDAPAAAAVLDPVLAATGDHPQRIALREARLASATTAAERARLTGEVRAILERDLGQREAAFMNALKAFTDGVDRASVQPELERLAQETGSFSELAEIYESCADELNEADGTALPLLRRAAELREQLAEPDEATRLWQRLRERLPTDRQALDALSRLYERSSSARQLAEVSLEKARVETQPDERAALLGKAAEAFEAAGDDFQAIEARKTVLALRRDLAGLQHLERLYGKVHRAADQAEVLAQLAEVTLDDAARLELLLKRSALLEAEEQPAEALATLSRALSLGPLEPRTMNGLERLLAFDATRLEAARLLEPSLRQANDLKRLVEVLEVRLAAVGPDRRGSLLLEIASFRSSVGQKSLAVAALLKAFGETPHDDDTRAALERTAAEVGAFEELAAAYEDALEKGLPPLLANQLFRRLGSLYSDRLSRFDMAALAYNEALKLQPADPPVLEALAEVYRRTSNYKELSLVMRRQLALEKVVPAQVNLLYELATLAEDTLSDKALATQCYQAILERAPDDPNAPKFLGRLLAETDRHAELAALLSREAKAAEAKGNGEAALDTYVRLARLKAGRLGDARGGLTLLQELLRRTPGHPGAIGAVEEMARSDNPLKGEAARTLEPVFENEGEHLKLVQMLESRVSAEAQPQERATLLKRMADVYTRQMANPEMAFVAATRALRELPDDGDSLLLCLSLYQKADAADGMLEVLEEVAPRAANDARRAELYRALARLQAEHNMPAAVDSWRHVVALVPADVEGMGELSRLLAAQGRAPELLDVLKRQVTIEEDPDRRVALLVQQGTLQDEQLHDAAGALATFRRVLELKPDALDALASMDGLCEQQQRWPELADVLTRRLRHATPEQQPELSFRLAVVRETKLLDKSGAIELYKGLLQQNPRHPGALGKLEALVGREPQNRQAVEALVEAYRRVGEQPKLAQVLEGRVQVSPDPDERKQLLSELATLRDGQGEPELAYLALYRAFKEDPNDGPLRARLEAAADVSQSYDELAAAYEAELPRIAEPADAAAMCLKLGQLNDQKLRDTEQAIVFYARAIEFSDTVAPKALPALDRLYGQEGDWARQADALEALAAKASEPTERIALSFRLGQLAMERLDSPDRAAAAFERVLVVDARHLPSLRSLEHLYEQAGTNDKLYRVLEAQRELVQGPERERLLVKMASVSSDGLDNVEHSISLYRELLEKNPRNEQAFEALSKLLDAAKRHDDLVALLQQRLTVTVDPRELVRLNDRLGRVLLDRLQRPEDAVPYFKAALERDPRHRLALEALRDIYDQLGRRDDLIVVLKRLIPLQDDSAGVKQVRLKLAEVVAQTARREEALDAARRALEVEPHTIDELDRVGAVFSQLKAWPDATRALDLKATAALAADDHGLAVQTLFSIGELLRGAANKPDSVGPSLERILEIEPSNRQAYEQARQLYSKVNDWRSYAQAVDRFVPNLVTDEEKVATLKELARVQETKLGQKDVAFLQYSRALPLNPADEEVREQFERLADETGSHDELAAVYEHVADEVPRGPLAERLYLTLAGVHDAKLDDADAAEGALRKILEFDPTNQTALDRLAQMFSRRGRAKDYVVSLEQKLEAAPTLEVRKDILAEIARVWEEQLNDPDEAEAALQRAAELEPEVGTLGALVALQRRRKDHAQVASTLLRMRDVASTPEERSKLQVEIAQVYERDLADDEASVEGYRQALEFDPANPSALDALERLYSKLDRPAELLAVYERQLEVTHDYRERVKVLFKSATIWEERFQNLLNADACIEGALQVEPQNLQAIKTLERLRKAQGRWDELIGVVDRHIQLLTKPQEKAELCVEMGDIFHQHLKAVDRAVTAYHQALELDPTCRPAMHALGTLYERSGNWPFALDMLGREATALGPTPEAVELNYRIGKINEDMLLDPSGAKQAFLDALRIDAGHLPSIRALKGLYELERDFGSYEKALLEEAKQTQEPAEKSVAYLEVARFYEGRDDKDNARDAYEEALKLVPQSVDAARPLADIYLSTDTWNRCEEMLDIVTRSLTEAYGRAPDDSELQKELCRRQYRLGYVCEKLGKKEKALGAYERAYQLDATYLPVLEGYGNLLGQVQRYEEGLKVYQSILVHHRGELTDLEVAEIYWTLGDFHLRLKQLDRAENHFEKALAIDAGHEPSLRAMVTIAETQQHWERAMEMRQRLLAVLDDGEPRFEAGVALGKLARQKVNDPYVAIDAYLAASKVRPSDLEVLDALYVLYRETKQGAKAAEVLEKMLGTEQLNSDAQRAKRVWFALGEISRDELKETERAVMAFNKALDLDWRFIEAFSAIEQVLGRGKHWKTLDENYKRMLARFPKTDETHAPRMAIWRALGDLYLNVMKAPDAAAEVYKVVAAGQPENAEIQELYATVAQTQVGHEQSSVDAWRRALPGTSSPGKVASALAQLAARRKDYDSAFLAAQVVAGLIGEPGAAEKEILAKLTPWAKKREVAQRALTDRLWQQHLFHPKVRGPLGELFAILFEQAGGAYKEDLAKYGINPKRHLIDAAQAPEYQLHHFRYVSRLLGMEQVPLFSPFLVTTRERMAKKTTEPAPDPMVGVELVHSAPAALKVGGKFFSETGQREVYYLLGRNLALMRPELALSGRVSAERLEAVLQAAVSLSVDRFRFTADLKAIDIERKLLERTMTEPARAALARVTAEYVKVATPNDLRNYLEGAELSATRAGAFAAGEIEPAKRMVMAETGGHFRLQPRSKIRDLMVFALGEDWHALRVAVGTSVEVQVARPPGR